jgi:transcriptional regulator with PAS, ATPase and Fis domain
MHDKDFRILRCNKAYQQRAELPFQDIIGQPYYTIFPKSASPSPASLRLMGKANTEANEEEVLVGETTYRLRVFFIRDKHGVYLYSMHILEDITEHKLLEAKQAEQLDELRRWHEATSNREKHILTLKHEVNELLGLSGEPPRYPSAESE